MESENIENDLDINAEDAAEEAEENATALRKTGVIYLSRIPQYMSVKKVRQIFEEYGEVDRIFLQPDEKKMKSTKRNIFSEGWVEFRRKKIAKRVADNLNNNRIGGKRRSRWYDEIWQIKYLSGFKWANLSERLAYEQAIRSQRMRTEITMAKKETAFYKENYEKNRILRRHEKKASDKGEVFKQRSWGFVQKDTEKKLLEKKEKKKNVHNDVNRASDNKVFLKNLFSGGID